MSITFEEIMNALDAIGELSNSVKKKYGIIHKQAIINYHGKIGRLVWDYILLNELTFEDSATGEQHSLGLTASDKKMEKFFNQIVEQFGIKE